MLTKIALGLGCMVFFEVGWLSAIAAVLLAVILIFSSCVIDGKYHNDQSITISYGVVVLIAAIVFLPFLWTMNWVLGYEVLGFWGSLAAIYLASTIMRLLFWSAEGIGGFLYKCLNGLLGGTLTPPDTQIVRYQCPVCGAPAQYAIDVCRRCGYGSEDQTTSGPYAPVERSE
jgi:hypothetical protein